MTVTVACQERSFARVVDEWEVSVEPVWLSKVVASRVPFLIPIIHAGMLRGTRMPSFAVGCGVGPHDTHLYHTKSTHAPEKPRWIVDAGPRAPQRARPRVRFRIFLLRPASFGGPTLFAFLNPNKLSAGLGTGPKSQAGSRTLAQGQKYSCSRRPGLRPRHPERAHGTFSKGQG